MQKISRDENWVYWLPIRTTNKRTQRFFKISANRVGNLSSFGRVFKVYVGNIFGLNHPNVWAIFENGSKQFSCENFWAIFYSNQYGHPEF